MIETIPVVGWLWKRIVRIVNKEEGNYVVDKEHGVCEILVAKKHHDYLTDLRNEEIEARLTMDAGSKRLRIVSERVWSNLNRWYPETGHKNTKWTMNWDTFIIEKM